MRKQEKASDQHKEFVKAARELGCDESEETFDRMLGKIASAPPPKTVQKRRKDAIQRRKNLVPAGIKPKRRKR